MLKSVTIPGTLAYFGGSAFSDCSSLEKAVLGEGITEIGMYAFSGCINLLDVNIPESVEEVGDGAFSACDKLLKYIGGVGYVSKWALNREYLPFGEKQNIDIALLDGTRGIADGAFAQTGITGITIPDSVRYIGKRAF